MSVHRIASITVGLATAVMALRPAGVVSAAPPQVARETAAGLAVDFAAARARHRDTFREALRLARDDMGWLLAGAWRRTSLDGVTYGKVLTHLLDADSELGTNLADTLLEAFRAREIVPTRADRPGWI